MSHPFPIMGVVLLNGEGCKEVHVGEIYEIGLSIVSERKSQTLSQRGKMLYREVCDRAKELSSWATWSKSKEVFRLWVPVARKTEGQKIVWNSGKPVP
jgi:hypothetical protein